MNLFHSKNKVVTAALLVWCLVVRGLVTLQPALAEDQFTIKDEVSGPFRILAKGSPNPPIQGDMQFYITLTDAKSGAPVNDAKVIIVPEMTGMAMPGVIEQEVKATSSQPNLYQTTVPLSMDGLWMLGLRINSPTLGSTNLSLQVKAEKPPAPWLLIGGLLVGLPVLAGGAWWFLFRRKSPATDDDED